MKIIQEGNPHWPNYTDPRGGDATQRYQDFLNHTEEGRSAGTKRARKESRHQEQYDNRQTQRARKRAEKYQRRQNVQAEQELKRLQGEAKKTRQAEVRQERNKPKSKYAPRHQPAPAKIDIQSALNTDTAKRMERFKDDLYRKEASAKILATEGLSARQARSTLQHAASQASTTQEMGWLAKQRDRLATSDAAKRVANIVRERDTKDAKMWVSSTLSKKNAAKLANKARNAPKWLKLMGATAAALGLVGIVNRAFTPNDTPPSDIEHAWTRIEKLSNSDLTRARREKWTDFHSPYRGAVIKALNSRILSGGKSAKDSIFEKALVASSIKSLMNPGVPLEKAAEGMRHARRITETTFLRGPKRTAKDIDSDIRGLIHKPTKMISPNALELSRPKPISTIPSAASNTGKSFQIMPADNLAYKGHPTIMAFNNRSRHHYAANGPAKNRHLFGGLL